MASKTASLGLSSGSLRFCRMPGACVPAGEGLLSKGSGGCSLSNGASWWSLAGRKQEPAGLGGTGDRVRLGMGLAALAYSPTQRAALPHPPPSQHRPLQCLYHCDSRGHNQC